MEERKPLAVPPWATQSLDELLRACTIRIKVDASTGTGFFVAPGLVLTCAHVVEAARTKDAPINTFWRNDACMGHLEAYAPKEYPDLALLDVETKGHPCVYFDESTWVADEMYSFGYPTEYAGGDSALFVYEGPAWEHESESQPDKQYLRLKSAQALPGFSGAPLLNRRTGGVCGILKRSRDVSSDLGGRGVPTSVILEWRPELRELQRQYHAADVTWITTAKRSEQPDVEVQFNNRAPVGLPREERLRLLGQLLEMHERNLIQLRLRRAVYAAGEVPLHVDNQIAAEELEIRTLHHELDAV
jgi:hypothetical protein